ncbi:site-specific integrase [Chroococcidiopsis sp. FACHB-1243]|uniref:site-specific integrase n=1 Tax=Chroococcidiopsis sp. [FACHB-1243] TaxID=2692781 RepID=UPI001786CA43|nr:site-specific integrase [Chroococcidiopsis sp. [FACHB-1243]]MBD2308872.1 site-specific integrase [Chroococcidiopsis sp. [FACHB-1243]]
MSIKKKASKGTVSVESFRGRLRLRFRIDGIQKTLAVNLDDTKENRIRASLIARQIELDLLGGTFDHTLEKYRPSPQKPPLIQNITVATLFEQFIDSKVEDVSASTLSKYKSTLGHIKEHAIGNKLVPTIGVDAAKEFASFLKPKLSERVYKERLGLLAACWSWTKQPDNPWKVIQGRVRVAPRRRPAPFTKSEVRAIIQAFKENRYYHHYAPYVEFLFLSGVRTGEARALRWGSVGSNTIWIGESISKGKRGTTKTNRDRHIPINHKLRKLLNGIKPRDARPDDLVFPSPTGKPIDEHNFAMRAWKKILGKLGIPYRRPYLTRATFISHALESGMSPVTVAAITGHDVRVLYDFYVGLVKDVHIPDLY